MAVDGEGVHHEDVGIKSVNFVVDVCCLVRWVAGYTHREIIMIR